ncbi:hypothetical protein AALB19_07215 [Oscillospiraceae bacterium 50-58]
MNLYHDTMENCAPPEGMRERLKENVLSARPGGARTYRPRKKRRAVLLLAAVLLLGTSATTIWDPLFVRRFGPQAALSALGGAVFQEVNLTSVCDDVSLTVTQALCSDKNIHFILEYKLPEGAPQEHYDFPLLYYYGTGSYTWEELRDTCREDWDKQDWSNWQSFSSDYMQSEANPLWPSRLSKDGSSGSFSGEPEDGVLTFCFSVDFQADVDLTAQPLTILATPPCFEGEDGTRIAVTDHPAIITFQPVYNGPQALSAVLDEGEVKITATLSPFSLALETEGMGYPGYEDMVKDARLVTRDGGEKKVSLMGLTNGGSSFGPEGQPLEVSTTVHFLLLTDISEFTALRMGDYTVPLE